MVLSMLRLRNIFRYILRRYCLNLFLILISCSCLIFVHLNFSFASHLESIVDEHGNDKSIVSHLSFENDTADERVNDMDLFDDDNMPFVCSSEFHFNIINRQHLVIILTSKMFSFVWKNFRALLCSGVDVYIMLDEVFRIDSSERVDFQPRKSRSARSYSHRFLYVANKYLAQFGVRYMKNLPRVEYTSWDRAVVWLYHRANVTTAWLLEHDVQWLDVRNMTYLFEHFRNDTADLLCDNIVQTNSFWLMWPAVQSDILPKTYWTGTFSPLVRWSRRLLQHHYQYMQLIHKDRLKYEINLDFRFQEFIMSTIAKTENLSIKMYDDNDRSMHIVLGNMDDEQILSLLRRGKYILHPVKQESILTKYRMEDITRMMAKNSLNLTNVTLLEKEIMKQ